MRRVCPVDVSGLVAALPALEWLPAGDPGTWAMIDRWPGSVPVEPVVAQVLPHFPGRVQGMTCFSRLVPGQYIPQHCDRHDAHCNVRIHVPLVTNPSVVFVNGTQAMHMPVGWAYEIDPTVLHCVANGGTIDRIHLFFNLKPEP